MKVRKGFVTNSSSICYILDLRDENVKDALQSTMRVMDCEWVWCDSEYGFKREQGLRNDGYQLISVKRNVKQYCKEIDLYNIVDVDWSRCTSYGIGEDVLQYMYSHLLNEYSGDFGEWLEKWIDELGEENILFLRESDEEMGGVLSDTMHEVIKEKSLDEREYH